MGAPDKAVAALRPWLGQASRQPAIALAYGMVAPHMGEIREAIASLRGALKLVGGNREIESTFSFRIGDLLDKDGRFDEAFDYYQRANRLRAVAYDHAGSKARFEALAHFFSGSQMPLLPRAANRSELPVFIVGMPRSGTTLVEAILASHAQVHGAGELDDVFLMQRELQDLSGANTSYPHCLESVSARVLDQVADRHLAKLQALAPDAARVTDKLPQNFLNLGLIELVFPGARVIHCARHPLDTCLSIYFQQFMQHHDYATELEHIGLYYQEYRRLMAHWRAVLRLPLLEVGYEDLTANPEATIRHLLEFCGLPWDERCLRHHETGRVARTFSYHQVRQPIYKTSVARWKRYEKHLGPLIAALGDACDPS
jgi:tetratricopeptide (TPR) repeat protein